MLLQDALQDSTATNKPDWMPQAEMLGGGILAGLGVLRGSLPGLIMTAIGGSLLYHGYQRCAACGRNSDTLRSMAGRAQQPASYVERSQVDEASWESFPASDPPGRY